MSGPPPTQHGRGARALAAAAVGVATTALWLRFNAPPPLGPERIGLVWHGDLLNYFVPMARQLAQRLSQGELPLWNPDACSGIPLLATLQVGALHPGSWLALVLHPIDAFAWRALIETALGAWGFAWFARALGLGYPAAGAAAIWFVFACLLGQSYWPPLLSVTAGVPWLFLAVERFLTTGALRWTVAIALVTCFEWIAGFPQVALYAGQLVVAYATVRLVSQARRAGRPEALRRGAALVAASMVGVGLASVQLLPTLELVGESARQGTLDPAEVHYLNHARPHTAGAVLRATLDPAPGSLTYSSGRAGGYLGVGTLLLIALGVVATWRRGTTRLWLFAGALALWLSDGFHGSASALYALYAQIPFTGSLRTPERLRLLWFVCAIALAATGFDQLAKPATDARLRRRLRWTVVVAGLGLALGSGFVAGWTGVWRAGTAAGAALFALRDGAPIASRRGTLALLGLALLADLLLATPPVGVLRAFPKRLADAPHAGPESAVDAAALAPVSASERVAVVGLRPRLGPLSLRRVSCQEVLLPRAWTDLHRALTGNAAHAAVLFDLPPRRFPVLYDLAGAKRIAIARRGELRVTANEDALPRAYTLDAFEVMEPSEALAALAAGDRDPRRRVLVDRDPGFVSGRGRLETARIVVDRPEQVVALVAPARASLLVLTDSAYPGWQVQVDGRPREIFTANGLHRAVRVEPGDRRVELRYRPASLRTGALLSVASLLLLAIAVGAARRGGAAW
jgi:hypothetical protein